MHNKLITDKEKYQGSKWKSVKTRIYSIQITLSKSQGYVLLVSEAYLELIRRSVMEFFARIVNC